MTDVPQLLPRLPDHVARMERARLSLDGLSVGDAFGQRFFYPPSVESLIAERALPQAPWHYTDDTEMALAIVETLHQRGRIDQDELAIAFARRYRAAPDRGYGGMACGILAAIGAGSHWSRYNRCVDWSHLTSSPRACVSLQSCRVSPVYAIEENNCRIKSNASDAPLFCGLRKLCRPSLLHP
jgi:ADP-ribosylglycohydrolase